MKKLMSLGLLAAVLSMPPFCFADAAAVPVIAAPAANPAVSAATALIARLVPGHAAGFVCETMAAENGQDVFEIESLGGKIVLRGNNGISLACAFNWYLKYTAGCEVSACGDQLKLPKVLPPVPAKIRIAATVPYRFMFNYCTYGYTMPWWGWERWERELDWLAMNGINLPFVITGQEAVWIKTMTQYGYTEKEIRQWLGSPAHFPWTFMQNMENFGGELPATWIPQRVALGQKIIGRAHELGMNVTLQGYYGMVPPGFAKRHPQVKVLPQGGWCGFKRPDMLDPADPIFAKIAATFMQEQEKLFGRAGFYTADPFHEGGNSAGVNMTDCGRRVFKAMCDADPKAVWIKMCWGSDNAALLADIPADRVFALDLCVEDRPFWPNGAFKGKSWIWCIIHNFGGNSDIITDLAHLSRVFPDTLANPKKGKLVGLGMTPEGHCNAPLVYALVPEFAWRDQPVDLKTWLPAYVQRRYGADSAQARLAWSGFANSIYGVRYAHNHPFNAIFQARPLRGEKACTWGTTQLPYAPAKLIPAWKSLLAAAPDCAASDAYRYDLADITRQVLADLSRGLYGRINAAAAQKDLAAFEKNRALYLDLLTDLDGLLATRPEFLLGTWLEDARRWGTTPEEKKLYEWQARTIITTWDDKPGTELNDYANRQWNGLVKDYYRLRWELYFGAVGEALKAGKPVDTPAFLARLAVAEKQWTQANNLYPTRPAGDTVEVARQLLAKYGPLLTEIYPEPLTPTPADVIGCWEYPAEGTAYLREFRADGTIQAYRKTGEKLPWLDGFAWRIEGQNVIAEKKATGMNITFQVPAKDVLEFTSEGFGKTKRVPVPGK